MSRGAKLRGGGEGPTPHAHAALQECKCFQIEVVKNYDISSFRADLLVLYNSAGVEGTPIVFLFADNQIVDETMLEDINSMLNTGEVPNLLAPGLCGSGTTSLDPSSFASHTAPHPPQPPPPPTAPPAPIPPAPQPPPSPPPPHSPPTPPPYTPPPPNRVRRSL